MSATLALLFLCAGLSGCGSSPTSGAPSPTTNPLLAALPSNMQIQLTYSVGTPTPVQFFVANLIGSLTAQGNTVSGTLRYSTPSASPCISPTADITYIGTIDANNLLTLTTTSFAGTTAIIALQLPAAFVGASYRVAGTAQLNGGSCAAAVTQGSAILVPSVTGTFTGSLTPSTTVTGNPATGPGGSATVVLTQASANADGQFPLTGTLNFTSPNCTLATPVAGIVSGLTVQLVSGTSFPTIPGAVSAVSFFGGAFSPGLAASQMDISVAVPGCPDIGFYNGSLTRQ